MMIFLAWPSASSLAAVSQAEALRQADGGPEVYTEFLLAGLYAKRGGPSLVFSMPSWIATWPSSD